MSPTRHNTVSSDVSLPRFLAWLGSVENSIKRNGTLVGNWGYSGGVREGQETLRPR
jgi:hypothetical protein